MEKDCKKQKNCFKITEQERWQKTFFISDGTKEIFSNDICKYIFDNTTFEYDEQNKVLKILFKGGEAFECDNLDNCKEKIIQIVSEKFYTKENTDEKLKAKQNELVANDVHFVDALNKLFHSEAFNKEFNDKINKTLSNFPTNIKIPTPNSVFPDKSSNDYAQMSDLIAGEGEFYTKTEVDGKLKDKQDSLSETQIDNINKIPDKQDQLTAGTNISISTNNEIESKPTSLYTGGIRSMSVIDEEKDYLSISALLTEIKTRCGDRGSGHFNLTITSQSDGNNRLLGYVEREYSQTNPFFKLFLKLSTNDRWLLFQNTLSSDEILLVGGYFYFNDEFNFIGADADVYVRINNQGSLYKGKAMNFDNQSPSVFQGWIQYSTEIEGPRFDWDILNSVTMEVLNSLRFIVNLGYQFGYNAPQNLKTLEFNKDSENNSLEEINRKIEDLNTLIVSLNKNNE